MSLVKIIEQSVASMTRALTGAIRDAVKAELRGVRALRGRAGAVGRPKKRNILPCIAEGCDKPSKGPRFRYLCDEHKGAGVRQVEEWRAAKKAAAAKGGTAAPKVARKRKAAKARRRRARASK